MTRSSRHFAAPWSLKLKVLIGVFVLVLLFGATQAGPVGATALVGVLVVCAALAVRGYSVVGDELLVHRLGWATRFDLSTLTDAEVAPGVTRGSVRTFGVGGLFGFVGRFRNGVLGPYRAYATDADCAVVLRLGDGVVVVTPDRPDAFVAAVERNDWMRPETKAEAIAKAQNMGLRIGHPEAWPDERAVRPDSVDLVATLLRADRLAWTRQANRLGAPHDPDAWAFLPQTFFAYYATPEPGIVFPAGILQPPFLQADDDVLAFGSIGVVIGHELTHGFDDRGRHIDARGDLRDWWHPDDAAEYRRRAYRVVEQFSAEEPLSGVRINGRLTLGENLADLAGTTLALEALEHSRAARGETLSDEDVRRFFLARARAFRSKHRPEHLHQWLMSQPHAPGRYRVNLIAQHLDAFHRAFGTAPGDGMWRAPEDRVRIW